ncbi:4-nitrophenyl phosphatase [Halolactibacillus halophilus]|uniref:4-nitrophenyl phosphatase n=1 Tax=Halolactibacillus halophilus TaxID=306540 RepID=A0A1I5MZN2_9BACI|nr:TIGR01457 family HAD-type hydrolase [Halolactibacillus halophilus]GEM01113.1 acid sugar phosphatase [Halolactibacillus halophilus]SFP15023.1 4-nitrophenyl phosphatase [Halolactibacillus halophilus]
MTMYSGYLIDLDGTVYNGTEKIPAAVEFVKVLNEKKIPYLFLTNNSTKHPRDVAEKLRAMDIAATENQVLTTSMATAKYVSEQHPGAKVYPIGEEGLIMALEAEGLVLTDDDPDYVVMGLDREITYEKLSIGALSIRNGAKFIATNGDIKLPSERGFLPGAGSVISVLSVTTEVEPKFIGKPEPIMVEQALEVLGTDKAETLMIGDNYYTDILAGINAGVDSLLVFTGVTKLADLQAIDKQPTYTIQSLADWKF